MFPVGLGLGFRNKALVLVEDGGRVQSYAEGEALF